MVGNTVKSEFMAYPIKIWSENTSNHCSFNMIPEYWKRSDILTFILDLGIYNPLLNNFLDIGEKEKVLLYKTDISRMRFILSRSILKHILSNIFKEKNVLDIVLISRTPGGIYVKDKPAISVSLSYSGTSIAITIGKVKVGSDIEVVRPVDICKIKKCPLFTGNEYSDEKGYIPNFLHLWTLIEAYSKLHDRNPYSLLNDTSLPTDAHFISYYVNNRSIFSVASSSGQVIDTLFWIDTECLGVYLSEMNNVTHY
jgi:4'-phosphopantetheinyl transferase